MRLLDRGRQLWRRLRHAGRAREPGRRQSRLIALPVTRIRARSAQPREPIVRLEGGPGITNMDFPQASRYTEKRDVVLVGYRGVDGSSILDRPEVESPMAHSSNFLSDDSLREQADGFSSCATRLRDDGVDLEGYTLTQRVEDLEAARRASATSASAQPAVLRSSPSGPRARVEALA